MKLVLLSTMDVFPIHLAARKGEPDFNRRYGMSRCILDCIDKHINAIYNKKMPLLGKDTKLVFNYRVL